MLSIFSLFSLKFFSCPPAKEINSVENPKSMKELHGIYIPFGFWQACSGPRVLHALASSSESRDTVLHWHIWDHLLQDQEAMGPVEVLSHPFGAESGPAQNYYIIKKHNSEIQYNYPNRWKRWSNFYFFLTDSLSKVPASNGPYWWIMVFYRFEPLDVHSHWNIISIGKTLTLKQYTQDTPTLSHFLPSNDRHTNNTQNAFGRRIGAYQKVVDYFDYWPIQ